MKDFTVFAVIKPECVKEVAEQLGWSLPIMVAPMELHIRVSARNFHEVFGGTEYIYPRTIERYVFQA